MPSRHERERVCGRDGTARKRHRNQAGRRRRRRDGGDGGETVATEATEARRWRWRRLRRGGGGGGETVVTAGPGGGEYGWGEQREARTRATGARATTRANERRQRMWRRKKLGRWTVARCRGSCDSLAWQGTQLVWKGPSSIWKSCCGCVVSPFATHSLPDRAHDSGPRQRTSTVQSAVLLC